ncbi:MAG: rRNA pseudouridine synthase [Planctomycetota bacterium]|nr:MAG: rRNA pseudouridine synthase [Planctomycetota bacterium]
MKARRPKSKGGQGRKPRKATAKVSQKALRRAHAFVAAFPGREGKGEGDPQDAGVQESMRLNRWLSEQGVASRRKADELIQEGHVEINGEEVTALGTQVRPGDQVRVKGKLIKPVPHLYYLFHKPKGVLCTENPRESRTKVWDLVAPMVPTRVYPVGRLDEESEGLLLLTNDGDFANLVAHPRFGVPKTYVVQLQGELTPEETEQVRRGVYLAEGRVVPSRVRVLRRSKKSSLVEIVLREGLNREVRRIFAKVGHGVRHLKRVRIGGVGLQGLPRGGLRPLTSLERKSLVALAEQGRETADLTKPKRNRTRAKRTGKSGFRPGSPRRTSKARRKKSGRSPFVRGSKDSRR